jgi:hypothetical protein
MTYLSDYSENVTTTLTLSIYIIYRYSFVQVEEEIQGSIQGKIAIVTRDCEQAIAVQILVRVRHSLE